MTRRTKPLACPIRGTTSSALSTEDDSITHSRGYWLVFFTRDTWERFLDHGACVVGFKPRHRRAREKVRKGDYLLAYIVGLSRWCGVLEVTGPAFEDKQPIFEEYDPYTLRLPVTTLRALPPERAVPMRSPELWCAVSFTKDLPLNTRNWAQKAGLRQTLLPLRADDGIVITAALERS